MLGASLRPCACVDFGVQSGGVNPICCAPCPKNADEGELCGGPVIDCLILSGFLRRGGFPGVDVEYNPRFAQM